MKINIKEKHILEYVVGVSNYDAIEKIIDPTRYEVFDCGIYDNKNKKMLQQAEDFQQYCRQVSDARRNANELKEQDIKKLVESLSQIAPKEINLDD